MRDMVALIRREKDKYLRDIQLPLLSRRIVIYGAGSVGKALASLLDESGIGYDGFCVDGRVIGTDRCMGKPVYYLDDICQDKSFFYLIAVHGKFKKKLEDTLQAKGIRDYLLPPKHMMQIVDNDSFRSRMEISPIVGCKVHCRYCPQDLLLKRYGCVGRSKVMKLAEYKACIDRLPQEVIVDFAGFVEPFLHDDAVEMIRYAHETGHLVELFTTLVGLTKKKFRLIKDIPFHRIGLHLADKEGYSNIPVTKEYLELLEEVLEAKDANGRPSVGMANCQTIPHPEVAKIIRGRVAVTWNLIDRAGNLEGDDLYSSLQEGPIYCDRSLHLNHNVLLPDGSVALCNMDYGLRHILGNLFTSSWEDLHEGAVIGELRRKMASGDTDKILCRRCSDAFPVDKEYW